jgi:catechol 2,3-dioxygenase-like lactoylglutathione lyase family enzyme
MNILRTAHAEFRVTDLDATKHFYVDALGFLLIREDHDRLYLGCMEERDLYSLVLRKSDKPGLSHLAFRVEKESDLDELAKLAEADKLKTRWLKSGEELGVERALRIQDPNGIPLEFFHKIERRPSELQNYYKYHGAAIQRIDHYNCQVTDVRKGFNWFTKRLGFHCSEYTAASDPEENPKSKIQNPEDPSSSFSEFRGHRFLESGPSDSIEQDTLWAVWMHRKQNVHDLANMNGVGPRLHHVGFWAYDRLSILNACDVLASMNMANHIERGPGRHGLSNAFFLYLRDPDNNRIEIYTGDYLITDWDMPPIRWSINDPRRATFWGHLPPKSWFEEASLVENISTGEFMPTSQPPIFARPEFVI